jgi:hypothetical protein
MRLEYGNGDLLLRSEAGSSEIRLDPDNSNISTTHVWLGGRGRPGLLTLFPERVSNLTSTAEATIVIDGNTGDITLPNADCAEDFDLASGEEALPGAVMVLDENGSLHQSLRAYDTAVVGVVSGAGTHRPGIILDRRAGSNGRVPLAMIGKVFCLVDADFGAVRAGALLTTSPRRGHAMRAYDPALSFGAVLGKALKPLEKGQGLIPIIVALQ